MNQENQLILEQIKREVTSLAKKYEYDFNHTDKIEEIEIIISADTKDKN